MVTHEKLVYSRSEAAKAAGLSLPKIDEWLHKANFPAFRAGRKWLIPVEPFKAWLEAQAGAGGESDGRTI